MPNSTSRTKDRNSRADFLRPKLGTNTFTKELKKTCKEGGIPYSSLVDQYCTLTLGNKRIIYRVKDEEEARKLCGRLIQIEMVALKNLGPGCVLGVQLDTTKWKDVIEEQCKSIVFDSANVIPEFVNGVTDDDGDKLQKHGGFNVLNLSEVAKPIMHKNLPQWQVKRKCYKVYLVGENTFLYKDDRIPSNMKDVTTVHIVIVNHDRNLPPLKDDMVVADAFDDFRESEVSRAHPSSGGEKESNINKSRKGISKKSSGKSAKGNVGNRMSEKVGSSSSSDLVSASRGRTTDRGVYATREKKETTVSVPALTVDVTQHRDDDNRKPPSTPRVSTPSGVAKKGPPKKRSPLKELLPSFMTKQSTTERPPREQRVLVLDRKGTHHEPKELHVGYDLLDAVEDVQAGKAIVVVSRESAGLILNAAMDTKGNKPIPYVISLEEDCTTTWNDVFMDIPNGPEVISDEKDATKGNKQVVVKGFVEGLQKVGFNAWNKVAKVLGSARIVVVENADDLNVRSSFGTAQDGRRLKNDDGKILVCDPKVLSYGMDCPFVLLYKPNSLYAFDNDLSDNPLERPNRSKVHAKSSTIRFCEEEESSLDASERQEEDGSDLNLSEQEVEECSTFNASRQEGGEGSILDLSEQDEEGSNLDASEHQDVAGLESHSPEQESEGVLNMDAGANNPTAFATMTPLQSNDVYPGMAGQNYTTFPTIATQTNPAVTPPTGTFNPSMNPMYAMHVEIHNLKQKNWKLEEENKNLQDENKNLQEENMILDHEKAQVEHTIAKRDRAFKVKDALIVKRGQTIKQQESTIKLWIFVFALRIVADAVWTVYQIIRMFQGKTSLDDFWRLSRFPLICLICGVLVLVFLLRGRSQ